MIMLIALAILSGLILTHELGHFLAAKAAGVPVKEVGLGYPPRLVTLGEWGGTLYTLNAIPFGGFVRLPFGRRGQISEEFASQPKGVRLFVFLAGPAMNFLVAVLLFTVSFRMGVPVPVGFGGAEVVGVTSGWPAERVGVKVGDVILEVCGEVLEEVEGLRAAIQKCGEEEMPLWLERDEESVMLRVSVPRVLPEEQRYIGVVVRARPAGMEMRQYSRWKPYVMGLLLGLRGLVVVAALPLLALCGRVPGENIRLSGPVGVVLVVEEAAAQVSKLGWFPLLQLTAVINLGLVVGNLLPIPALDGGHIVLLALEAIRGRRLSPGVERRVHLVGFAVLMALMVLVTYSDLVSEVPVIGWP